MSKYTTEVRFICESLSGLDESKGGNNVDTIIANAWDKVFTTTATFTVPEYKAHICKAILKHYYTREIGAETVGLWKLWMNERFETILPYYNQLYQSQLVQFDPMKDVNFTRTLIRDLDSSEAASGSNSGTSTGTHSQTETQTKNNVHRDLYSDTPQGAVTGLENENYLTNARKVTDSASLSDSISGNESGSTSGQFSNSGTNSTDERITETINGKRNGTSYSKLLQEFRDTLINLDMMIIEEFNDLFFGLW